MKKPLYNSADRWWMRSFPESSVSVMMRLTIRKKHLYREFDRLGERIKTAFK